MWRKWGITQNFFLAFTDELEKQRFIKKNLNWANKKCKNFNIYNVVFFNNNKEKHQEILFYTCFQKSWYDASIFLFFYFFFSFWKFWFFEFLGGLKGKKWPKITNLSLSRWCTQPFADVLQNSSTYKFCKIHRKTTALKSIFKKEQLSGKWYSSSGVFLWN